MATRKSSRIAAKRKPLVKRPCPTPENGGSHFQCSICLGDITFRGRLSVCKHKFCYSCILEWSKNTNTCPLCKKRFRCITRVCLMGRTPPRQVRVADRNGREDDNNDYSDDEDDLAITGNIRESIIDYLTCLTPKADYNGVSLNEYDCNDSFIDDSQLSSNDTSFSFSNSHYSSPGVHDVRRPERRAYLMDSSESEASPQPNGRRLDDPMQKACDGLSYGVIMIPDTPDRSVTKSPHIIKRTTNGKRSNSKSPRWLTTRKGKQHRHVGRQLNFF